MAAAPALADSRDTFEVGSIWEGGAYFTDDGTFSNCYLDADFPEGWQVSFYLPPDRELEIELEEPEGMDIDVEPDLTLGVDGQRLAAVPMMIDEEALWMMDWLIVYAFIGRIEDVGVPLRTGDRLTLILDGLGMDGQAKTWTYSAALTGSGRAFAALESCVAQHGGAAPQRTGDAEQRTGLAGRIAVPPSSGSIRSNAPPSYYGAIAIGEYDDGLLSGMAIRSSVEEAEAAAIENCNQDYYGACLVEAWMDDSSPCGAVAAGHDPDGYSVYGWSTAGTDAEARLGAMEACSEDALGCEVVLNDCVYD